MHRLFILAVFLSSGVCVAASPSRQHIAPEGKDKKAYDLYHYSPAVRVGDTVYVSGIPAAPGVTYEARVRSMFERMKTLLAASGAAMSDVVEIGTFHARPKGTPEFLAEFEIFKAIHAEYFKDHYPAWTAVGTTALLAQDAPVEMRAVAVVGSGRTATVTPSYTPDR